MSTTVDTGIAGWAPAMLDEGYLFETVTLTRECNSKSVAVAFVAGVRPPPRDVVLSLQNGPDHLVALPAFPRCTNGSIDVDALAALPLIDDALLDSIEEEFSGRRGIEIVARAVRPAPQRLHVSAWSDDWKLSLGAETSGASFDATEVSGDGPEAVAFGGELDLSLLPADTLGACLRRLANEDQAITFVDANGIETTYSYKDFLKKAKMQLAALQAQGLKPGDRVLFQLNDVERFAALFWACQLGGIVAAPLAVPGSYAADDAKALKHVWLLLGRPLIAADPQLTDEITDRLAELGDDPPAMLSVDVRSDAEPILHNADPEDLCLLLFTSGSTGLPKAVMLSHQNVLARIAGQVQREGLTDKDVGLNWIPLDHVGGIVMCCCRDVVLALRSVQVSTHYIMSDVARWFELLDKFRGTLTWAPNFAYALVGDRAADMAGRNWDLSHVRHMLNGGEAVSRKTAQRFIAALSAYGIPRTVIQPAWGMSETSSGSTSYEGFDPDKIGDGPVCVGPPLPGTTMMIADKNGRPVRGKTEGRLLVKGPVVTRGYFGNDEATRQAFTDDGWFETGDLGFIEDKGVTITGRLKNVVIVNGVNINSEDLEAAVDRLEEVRTSFSAVVGVPGARDGKEGLAVFFSPLVDDESHIAYALPAVARSIQEGFGISADFIIPVSSKDVPKTSIGKIQREALKSALLEGAFDERLQAADRLLGNERTLPRRFFERVWLPAGGPTAHAPHRIIAFVKDDHFSDSATERLRSKGLEVIEVRAGARFDQETDDTFTVQPGLDSDVAKVLERVARADEDDADSGELAILYLWNVAEVSERSSLRPPSRTALEEASSAYLAVLKGLGSQRARILAGSVRPEAVQDGELTDPGRSLLLGLSLSASQELQNVTTSHVNLAGENTDADVAAILNEVLGGFEAGTWAYREGQRLEPRLAASVFDRRETFRLHRGGCYLITGDLTATAYELAKSLLEKESATVLIVGQSALGDSPTDESTKARFTALQAMGDIHYAATDVSQRLALTNTVRGLLADDETLDGVFHLAGNYGEERLMEETDEGFGCIASSQLYGAYAITTLLDANPDAFLVFFSSYLSFYGAPECSSYAAVNQAVDSLAQALNAKGRRAISIGWTNFDGLGPHGGATGTAALQAMGILPVSLSHMVQATHAALALGRPRIVYGLDPIGDFVQRHGAVAELAQDIEVLVQPGTDDKAFPEAWADMFGSPIRLSRRVVNKLPEGETKAERRQALNQGVNDQLGRMPTEQEGKILEIWKQVLGVPDVGLEDNFFALGGHSLLATELAARIADVFPVDWTMRDIFERSTVTVQAAAIPEGAGKRVQNQRRSEDVITEVGLTPAQQRMWFLHRLDPASPVYTVEGRMTFQRGVDADILGRALDALVERHETLRVRFFETNGQIRQAINSGLGGNVSVRCLRQGESLNVAARAFAELPWDLARPPLYRFELIETDGGAAHLLLNIHHIICDGWSVRVICREIIENIRALERGEAIAERRYPTSLADFVAQAEATYEAAVPGDPRFDYWADRLATVGSGTALISDQPTSNTVAKTSRVTTTVNKHTLTALNELGRASNTTLFVLLYTAFASLLARLTRDDEITVGTVTAGRGEAGLQNLVGCLINVVVLHGSIDTTRSFSELAKDLHESILDLAEFGQVPFDALVRTLRKGDSETGHPFFQIAFDMHYHNLTTLPDDEVTLEVGELHLGARYDLQLTIKEHADGLTCFFDHNERQYSRHMVQALADAFAQLLDGLAAQPSGCVSKVPLLGEEMRRRLIDTVCLPSPRQSPVAATIVDLFAEKANESEHALALAGPQGTLTYRELDAESDRLAAALVAAGTVRGDIVALLLPRGPGFVVAMLGALKAGAAFLPIDMTYPDDRVRMMLEDASPRLVVTEEPSRASGFDVVAPSAAAETVRSGSGQATRPTPEDVAYVIYTSGSSGVPKGAILRHRGLTNLVEAQCDTFAVDRTSRVLQFAALGFDAVVSEVFTALTSGACLVLPPQEGPPVGDELAAFLADHAVSVATIPPSIMAVMPSAPLPQLKTLVSAGEPCRPDLVAKWAPGRRYVNAYGPTEATVCASMKVLKPEHLEAPTIGQPMTGVAVYLTDQHGHLVPQGLPGELVIGGEGVAAGYLNRPDLTEKAFGADEFGSGGRVYRTGDLGRYTKDSEIAYLGRIDEQVKHRGFRIEPKEIEACLLDTKEVGSAAVIVQPSSDSENSLIAFVSRRSIRSGDQLEWWPSISEFFVYDELMYRLMTHDELRNEAYREAARRLVAGKVVLDVGTGRDAILARICVEAGARKVYAVDILEESYLAAKETVARLGLNDKIEVIHGNASKVDLAEKPDVCISELVGAIGGSEGAAVILDQVRGKLADDGVMIPSRSLTLIGLCALPEQVVAHPRFEEVGGRYVEKIFEEAGKPFDLRVCVRGTNYDTLCSTAAPFEDLQFNEPMAAEATHDAVLEVTRDADVSGFLVWLTLDTAEGLTIDCLQNEHCWIPVFLPAFEPSFSVKERDSVKLTIERKLCKNGLNPDFTIRGKIVRDGSEIHTFEVNCPHVADTYRGSPFYDRILGSFEEEADDIDIDALRETMRSRLPGFMVPDRIVVVDDMPITPNGKLDRKALLAPEVPVPTVDPVADTPASGTVEIIKEAWRAVLGVERIGVDQNFFDVGGHSIRMAKVQTRLKNALGREVPLVLLFKNPTIRRQAEAISREAPAPPTANDRNRRARGSDRLSALAKRRGSRATKGTRDVG